MLRTNQIIALLTALAIVATTLLFAQGQLAEALSPYFSFDILSSLAKLALNVAMLIIIAFSRPRSALHRTIIATAAITVLGYATFGAIVGSLPLGDALIYFAGALIAMTEAVEATMPRGKKQPSVQLPGFLARL